MPFVSTKLNLISQQQERKLKHDRTEIAFKYEIKKKYVYNSNILKIEFVVRVKTKKKKKQILKEKMYIKYSPGFCTDNNLDFEMKDIDGNSIGTFCKSQ